MLSPAMGGAKSRASRENDGCRKVQSSTEHGEICERSVFLQSQRRWERWAEICGDKETNVDEVIAGTRGSNSRCVYTNGR